MHVENGNIYNIIKSLGDLVHQIQEQQKWNECSSEIEAQLKGNFAPHI